MRRPPGGRRSRDASPRRGVVRRALRLASAFAALLVAGTAAGAVGPCRSLTHDGAAYTVCSVRADRDDLRLWHSDGDGALLGSFRAVDSMLRDAGARLVFAMNAGMYHDDRRPVGLYVEAGERVAPLVTRAGPGNFGLLPNGVFCIGKDRAAVIESRRFAEDGTGCLHATQSGPMLVIDGALHPRFLPASDSLHIRNGVGVAADGVTVHFAISEERVNFHAFGRLFRDVLETPNALYLDGKVSRLWAPGIGRADLGFMPLGPIVGVAAPAE